MATPPLRPSTPSSEDAGDLRRAFETQGYVHRPRFFSKAEVETLQNAIRTTGESRAAESLNKGPMLFYSNIFRASEVVRTLIAQQKVVDLLRQVVGPDLWIRWDQCVVKRPGAPAFPWHQDNAYNGLREMHYQLWIALSDMDERNGGLWLEPGSHRHGLLPHRRSANHFQSTREPEHPRLIPAEKGDVILFSSWLLHHTKPNDSTAERWAYVVEYMSLDDYDPLVTAPYFIVSEDGVPTPRFVETYRGRANLRNRLRYLPLQVTARCKQLVKGWLPLSLRDR